MTNHSNVAFDCNTRAEIALKVVELGSRLFRARGQSRWTESDVSEIIDLKRTHTFIISG